MKTYRWILLTVLVLSMGFPTMTAIAATASVSLTSPMPNPTLIGSEITFDLVIAVADVIPGVSGAEIYLSYNPVLAGPPPSPSMGAAEVRPDFFGTSNVGLNEVLPAAQCPGGTSPCVHVVMAGPAQTSQTGVAVRFHFATLAQGTACFSVLQSTMVDANGFQVVHVPAQDVCATIQSRTTTGLVQRQGVPANPNPGGGTFACSSVTGTGSWTFGPVNTDTTGRFTLINLPNGTYTIQAVYPGYLASQKAGVYVAGTSTTVDIGSTVLRGGDVNGDNAINILDIGSIISKFGRTGVAVKSASVSCGTDEAADINDDGLVNISDLAIAAGNWGLIGPTIWP